MADTTVKKVSEMGSPEGGMGQTYLASGTKVAMRMWREAAPSDGMGAHSRDYETVGYVVSGRAELTVAGQVVTLEAGDSWVVPAGAEHDYRILEAFTAVEATAPPARAEGRDAA